MHSLFSIISSLLSLLSSLCSLPSSLLGTEPFLHHPAPPGTEPLHHSTFSSWSLLSSIPWIESSTRLIVYSLLSLLSALFPLLSLLLISQIALRTYHFELCMRPSNPLPTESTRPVASPSRPPGTEPLHHSTFSSWSLLSSIP